MQVWSLSQEDSLEKEMVTRSSILAWKIPWTEEPGGLPFIGSQSQTQLINWTTTKAFNKLRRCSALKSVPCATQIHIYPEPQKEILFGNRVFAGTFSRGLRWYHMGLQWNLKPMTSVPMEKGKDIKSLREIKSIRRQRQRSEGAAHTKKLQGFMFLAWRHQRQVERLE